MTPTEARAQVFFTAFKTLHHDDQALFFSKILKNASLREDLVDLAIIESRKHEKTRPFSDVIKEIKQKRGK